MEQTATPSRRSSSRHRRHRMLAGVIALALGASRGGLAQQAPPPSGQAQIIIGAEAQRFAVPDCIPLKSDDASREVCRAVTQVLRNDLKFEGLFQFVPESLFSAIPAMNPEAPNFEDWKSIGAKVLVVTRAQVDGGQAVVEAKVFFVDSGQNPLSKRYSGSAENPRIL